MNEYNEIYPNTEKSIETTTYMNIIIKNKFIKYKYSNDNDIEKITLPKGTVLYRSDTDICDFKKKKICHDTRKSGIYFSDNVMIPFGMSFEYKNKFGSEKKKEIGGALFGEIKKETDPTPFKEHQIGVFITTGDIEFYLDKYSYRKTGLGGEGYKNYSQKPKNNINHVDFILPILYDENNNNEENRDEKCFFELLFKTNNDDNNFLEFFIAEDKDLEKIKLVKATIFNIDEFKKKAVESFHGMFNKIFNYFSNEYISTLQDILCEEIKDGTIKKKNKKSNNKTKKKTKKSRKKEKRYF